MMLQEVWSEYIKRRSKCGLKVHCSYGKKERTWFKKMQHFRTDRDNNPEIKKVYKLNAVRVENEVLVRIQDPPGIRTE